MAKQQNIEEWADKIISLRKYPEDGSTEMYLRSFRREFGKELLREILAGKFEIITGMTSSEAVRVKSILLVAASHNITLED